MKYNRNLSRLVKEFLKTSPRSMAKKSEAILPPVCRRNLKSLMSDQQYLNSFVIYLDASEMYSYFGPKTIKQQNVDLSKNTFLNPLSRGFIRRNGVEIKEVTDKKTILFQLIKKISLQIHSIMAYNELQEFLIQLKVQEIKRYKNIIVHLYKYLLNQKQNFSADSIQLQLCQDISQTIIKKIYESYEKGDYQLLKNVEEELFAIETLEKARESKRNGKLNEARETYETVYFARFTQQSDRVEAFQYICESYRKQKSVKSVQNLLKMIERIRQGSGLKSHEQTLTKIMKQIIDSKPLEQVFINSINLKTDIENPQLAIWQIVPKEGVTKPDSSEKQISLDCRPKKSPKVKDDRKKR